MEKHIVSHVTAEQHGSLELEKDVTSRLYVQTEERCVQGQSCREPGRRVWSRAPLEINRRPGKGEILRARFLNESEGALVDDVTTQESNRLFD